MLIQICPFSVSFLVFPNTWSWAPWLWGKGGHAPLGERQRRIRPQSEGMAQESAFLWSEPLCQMALESPFNSRG